LAALESKAARLNGEIDIIPILIARIEGEYPAQKYALEEAESFPCPICEVPVDRVLAGKCNLSHKLPDIDACKRRLQQNRTDYEQAKVKLEAAKGALAQLKSEIELAKHKRAQAEAHYNNLEMARDSQGEKRYEARRLIDEIEQLADLEHQHQQGAQELRVVADDIERNRLQVGEAISQQSRIFSDLNEKLDAIIRRLIGAEASASLRLTGKGLELKVQLGGNRSTSAIDSLKVVAFDLAALCLSIEGKTQVPAFLVHDSPREADLGLSLYERLFHFVHELEGVTKTPAFQYIITTTTMPPETLAKEPWLTMTLSGSPASKRLLKQDL